MNFCFYYWVNRKWAINFSPDCNAVTQDLCDAHGYEIYYKVYEDNYFHKLLCNIATAFNKLIKVIK